MLFLAFKKVRNHSKSFLVRFPPPDRKIPPGNFPIPLPLNAIWKTLDKGPSLLQLKFNFSTENIFCRVVS